MSTVTIIAEEVLHETDLAMLFSISGDEVWIPKSVIDNEDDLTVGEADVEVEVAEWFAKKEGLV